MPPSERAAAMCKFADSRESWLTTLERSDIADMFRIRPPILEKLVACISPVAVMTNELIDNQAENDYFAMACNFLLQTLQHTLQHLQEIPMNHCRGFSPTYAARISGSGGWSDDRITNENTMCAFTKGPPTVQLLFHAGIPL